MFYEVFTGRRAFEAKTLAELRAKKETSSPTAPSEIVRDIDPIVERVILRCIERDPRQRPASAAQVAAALPGGDPLAAALAAGETPSPEMVAASGSTEGLKPWIAWACLAFVILGIGTYVLMKPQTDLFFRAPIEKPPEVMVQSARDILKSVGYTDPPGDSAFGFESNGEYLEYVEKNDQSPNRFDNLPAFTIKFWYRQSPQALVFTTATAFHLNPAGAPLLVNGDSLVWLDSRGNLIKFQAIPMEGRKLSGAAPPPDWSVLFKAAGLDPAKFTPVEPDSRLVAYADLRAAWTGALADRRNTPARIEAASWQGKPVSWQLSAPWDESPTIAPIPRWAIPMSILLACILLGCPIGAAFFARRNMRMGRGNRRGAARVACFGFIVWVFGGTLGLHHSAEVIAEAVSFFSTVGFGLFFSGLCWLMYIAIEPFVRRRWPAMLVGWSRLLAWNYRDPLIGRDLLVGCVAGVALVLLDSQRFHLASWFGYPQLRPAINSILGVTAMDLFSGVHTIWAVDWRLFEATFAGLFLVCLLFLLRVLLRSTWAAAILWFLFTAIASVTGGLSLYSLIPSALGTGILLFIIFRFGLLAVMAAEFMAVLPIFPITTQLSAWYSWIGLTGLALLLAFALYAFHTSLGGQSMFGRATLED